MIIPPTEIPAPTPTARNRSPRINFFLLRLRIGPWVWMPPTETETVRNLQDFFPGQGSLQQLETFFPYAADNHFTSFMAGLGRVFQELTEIFISIIVEGVCVQAQVQFRRRQPLPRSMACPMSDCTAAAPCPKVSRQTSSMPLASPPGVRVTTAAAAPSPKSPNTAGLVKSRLKENTSRSPPGYVIAARD